MIRPSDAAANPATVGKVTANRQIRRRWVNWFSKSFVWLQRAGISTGRAYVLTTTGRRTGRPRKTPVGVVSMAGQRYIFQAYPGAAWVANARANPTATLASGRRSTAIELMEVPVEERRTLLRDQLRKESGRTGKLLVKSGLVTNSDPDAVAQSAERIAVFRIKSRTIEPPDLS